jgi:F0F1-type ATP synthase assembly protein I
MVAAPGGDPSGPRPKRSPEDERRELQQWYQTASVGVEFAVAILLFGAIGWYLDRLWQTPPWFMLIGGGFGFATGLYLLIRMAKKSFHD